jgi:hypothetical protein
METVTDKKFLTEEEKTLLTTLQEKTQSLIVELGETELAKIQLENRHNAAKTFLSELAEQEKTFTKDIFEKYGKCNIDPQTGEITLIG